MIQNKKKKSKSAAYLGIRNPDVTSENTNQ